MRDSMEYALLLLETGEAEELKRATKILEAALAQQITDPASKWYGLWGYYLEEPPDRMAPADWNWADFNGATLLTLYARHQRRLAEPLAIRVREAIRHAAASVRRRNVAMSYTNIAVKGTFVTLAAAESLKDQDLLGYALDRLHRFAKTVDETGSFAEYNSPTYAQVSLTEFTRMRMFVRTAEARALADKLHRRLWEHLARHWHAPTAQFAGPMSRCYITDLGAPLWLQKSLNGAVQFAILADIRAGKAPAAGEVGLFDYQCPADLRSSFITLKAPAQYRELFALAPNGVRPVQGATWLTPQYSLGSCNRSDFWVQRRPLLAYFGNAQRPARYLQLRVIKDDLREPYDFTSALFYSVQERNCLLGAVNFCTPGGDKHPGLDPIQNGQFQAARLYLQFLVKGWEVTSKLIVDGRLIEQKMLQAEPVIQLSQAERVTIEVAGCRMCVTPRMQLFGAFSPSWRLTQRRGEAALELDLLGGSELRAVKWSEAKEALAAFTLVMDASTDSVDAFDQRCAGQLCEVTQAGDRAVIEWSSAAGQLRLAAGRKILAAKAQHELFDEQLNGQPVPFVRLSEARFG